MTADELPHGLHLDVTNDAYHARSRRHVVSKSALDQIHRSPLHYLTWFEGPPKAPTPAMIIGSAFHCALLEPDRYAHDYAVAPDFGNCSFKDNKSRRDRWRDENRGRIQLDAEDDAAIRAMTASVKAHPIAGAMIRDGVPELTVRWRDQETGLEGKCRPDYFVERLAMVVDVKTTEDARPEAFTRSVANYRYAVQAALYSDGMRAAGAQVEHFVFLAVEKTPPYAVALFALDREAMARAAAAAHEDILTLARCLERGEWPAYPPNIQTLSLPTWAA